MQVNAVVSGPNAGWVSFHLASATGYAAILSLQHYPCARDDLTSDLGSASIVIDAETLDAPSVPMAALRQSETSPSPPARGPPLRSEGAQAGIAPDTPVRSTSPPRHYAHKRGGIQRKVSLDEALSISEVKPPQLFALNEALERLGQLNARQGQVVDLRYLAGLTVEETANVLGVSAETVKLDWRLAKAWLQHEIGKTI